MMRAADNAAIRSAIGVGTTDAPTFGQFITLSDATNFTYVNFGGSNQIQRESNLMWFNSAGSRELGFTIGGPIRVRQGGGISWWDDIRSGTLRASIFSTVDNIIEQRNGTNAQAFRVYNTYTDASNYERGGMAWSAGAFQIGVLGTLGTGNPQRAIQFLVNNGAAVWTMSVLGHFLPTGDNAYDIGASGANRPRSIYVGSNITADGSITSLTSITAGTNGYIFHSGRSAIGSNGAGIHTFLDSGGTFYNRLQLGGTTSAFPAIKRNGTGIDIVLANDSGFAPVKGKLTTDTNYTAGVPSATGYLTIYDATGTAYRVPCTV